MSGEGLQGSPGDVSLLGRTTIPGLNGTFSTSSKKQRSSIPKLRALTSSAWMTPKSSNIQSRTSLKLVAGIQLKKKSQALARTCW